MMGGGEEEERRRRGTQAQSPSWLSGS